MNEFREALQTLITVLTRDREYDAKHGGSSHIDHACCECRDDPIKGPSIPEGWLCAYHAAKALLARPEPSTRRVYIDEAQTCTVIGDGQYIGSFTSKPRHSTDIAFVPETFASATDEELRSLMRAAGGRFHGPRIEHLSIPETAIFAFLRSVLPEKQSAKTETAAAAVGQHPAIELLKGMCHIFNDELPSDPGECGECISRHGEDCEYHAAAKYLRKLADGVSAEAAAAKKTPHRRFYVFMEKRPCDKQAWPLLYDDPILADKCKYRISPVVPVDVPSPPAATAPCEECGGSGVVVYSFDPYLSLGCTSCNRHDSPPAATGEK